VLPRPRPDWKTPRPGTSELRGENSKLAQQWLPRRKLAFGEGTRRAVGCLIGSHNAGKARRGRLGLSTRTRPEGKHMDYEILFTALCAVIAANILVAVIAIIRAFRKEKRVRRVQAWPRRRALHS